MSPAEEFDALLNQPLPARRRHMAHRARRRTIAEVIVAVIDNYLAELAKATAERQYIKDRWKLE